MMMNINDALVMITFFIKMTSPLDDHDVIPNINPYDNNVTDLDNKRGPSRSPPYNLTNTTWHAQ